MNTRSYQTALFAAKPDLTLIRSYINDLGANTLFAHNLRPLLIAVSCRHPINMPLVKLLVEQGADPNFILQRLSILDRVLINVLRYPADDSVQLIVFLLENSANFKNLKWIESIMGQSSLSLPQPLKTLLKSIIEFDKASGLPISVQARKICQLANSFPELVNFTRVYDEIFLIHRGDHWKSYAERLGSPSFNEVTASLKRRIAADFIPQSKTEFETLDLLLHFSLADFYNPIDTQFKKWDDFYFETLYGLAKKGCVYAQKKLEHYACGNVTLTTVKAAFYFDKLPSQPSWFVRFKKIDLKKQSAFLQLVQPPEALRDLEYTEALLALLKKRDYYADKIILWVAYLDAAAILFLHENNSLKRITLVKKILTQLADFDLYITHQTTQTLLPDQFELLLTALTRMLLRPSNPHQQVNLLKFLVAFGSHPVGSYAGVECNIHSIISKLKLLIQSLPVASTASIVLVNVHLALGRLYFKNSMLEDAKAQGKLALQFTTSENEVETAEFLSQFSATPKSDSSVEVSERKVPLEAVADVPIFPQLASPKSLLPQSTFFKSERPPAYAPVEEHKKPYPPSIAYEVDSLAISVEQLLETISTLESALLFTPQKYQARNMFAIANLEEIRGNKLQVVQWMQRLIELQQPNLHPDIIQCLTRIERGCPEAAALKGTLTLPIATSMRVHS